jgi:hypothetical protein
VTGLALATINNKLQVLAGIYGGVLGVFDVSSSSWITLTREGPDAATRITLAAAKDPQTVYAAFGSGGPIYGIYKTTNFGIGWQQLSVPPGTNNSTYGLTLAVDPGNSNIVMLGEIHMWRSINGGNDWTDVSLGTSATANVALHVDQHAIVFDSTTTPSRVYVGNDGGVWRSDDGCANWVSLNKGIQITQFNSMDTSGPAVMLAGSQDNGSMGWFGNPAFTLLVPGDGGQVYAAHQELTSNWLAARAKDQQLGLQMSADFGITWSSTGAAGLPLPDKESYGFYPPFALIPGGYFFIGGQRLFAQSGAGQPWKALTGDLTENTAGAYISTIQVERAQRYGSLLLVGTSNGLLWAVEQHSVSGTWHATKSPALTGDPVRYISPKFPAGRATAIFVLTGGFSNPHVFSDAGAEVFHVMPTPLIPNTNPVNCVEVAPKPVPGKLQRMQYFFGCDVGIYRYDQWSKTWTEWDEGLPNVAVVGLRWTDDGSSGGILRAVTHGRGIWERPVDAVSTPAVDLYMRHSDLDDGRLPVSTAAIPVARRPLRVVGGYGYEHQGLITPDVKLDTPYLNGTTWVYQFSDPAIDFAQFAKFDVFPSVAGPPHLFRGSPLLSRHQ